MRRAGKINTFVRQNISDEMFCSLTSRLPRILFSLSITTADLFSSSLNNNWGLIFHVTLSSNCFGRQSMQFYASLGQTCIGHKSPQYGMFHWLGWYVTPNPWVVGSFDQSWLTIIRMVVDIHHYMQKSKVQYVYQRGDLAKTVNVSWAVDFLFISNY